MSYKIDAPGTTVAGRTISDWTENWWKWVFQGPPDPFNPTDDPIGLLGLLNNQGPVFFLAGTNGITDTNTNQSALRFIVVPHGKPVLVPMINAVDVEGPGIPGTTDPNDPKPNIDVALGKFLDTVTEVHATIDGRPVVDPLSYKEQTDFFSLGTGRPGTLIAQASQPTDITGVELSPAKATGYYFMVEDLSRGFHTIEFGGKTSGGFSTDTKDLLLVV